MTSNLITVGYDDRISDIADIFEQKGIHHIPVIKNDEFVGIISSSDVERCKHGKSLFINHDRANLTKTLLESTLASMIMSKNVVTIKADKTIFDAYEIFKKSDFRALPVVDDGQLVGIISPMDFLDYFFTKN